MGGFLGSRPFGPGGVAAVAGVVEEDGVMVDGSAAGVLGRLGVLSGVSVVEADGRVWAPVVAGDGLVVWWSEPAVACPLPCSWSTWSAV